MLRARVMIRAWVRFKAQDRAQIRLGFRLS